METKSSRVWFIGTETLRVTGYLVIDKRRKSWLLTQGLTRSLPRVVHVWRGKCYPGFGVTCVWRRSSFNFQREKRTESSPLTSQMLPHSINNDKLWFGCYKTFFLSLFTIYILRAFHWSTLIVRNVFIVLRVLFFIVSFIFVK